MGGLEQLGGAEGTEWAVGIEDEQAWFPQGDVDMSHDETCG